MDAKQPSARLLTFPPALVSGVMAGASEHYRATGRWLPEVAELYQAVLASELWLTPTEFPWGSW